eukprot:CAMPEP_0197637630 /NCGR_PEP_ID=MMETSP1338-20131121/12795_1 /TAXON_ID=43686 ORGANISM="Pelagodinium beii, Strain RCC1491" /NCGR_SAMPLE_ID=MMETSP1338 /ASSEMBLY_ACC=CAM_ASM_000754 /LENGTH=579 /DNA_ID=CAMNT_0043210069 /DNA_START=72 /DNA_END=1808 /DNA_ORIENTATION=-
MPRGHRRSRRKEAEDSEDALERTQRTVIFSKTKMCKFHILGACSKGAGCKFAHQKYELQSLPDLACTKLCKTLISTGSCEDPDCRYAHNRDQLKEMPNGEVSPLIEQLKQNEAQKLASAALAAAKAASSDEQHLQKQRAQTQQLEQQLRQQLNFLQSNNPEALPPGMVQTSQNSVRRGPDVAMYQQMQVPCGYAETGYAAPTASTSDDQAAFFQQMVALQLQWAANQQASAMPVSAPAPGRQAIASLGSQAGPVPAGIQPWHNDKDPACDEHPSQRADSAKVLSLASELSAEPTVEELRKQLQQQQLINMQLRAEGQRRPQPVPSYSGQLPGFVTSQAPAGSLPGRSDKTPHAGVGKQTALKPKMVVKNTFIDFQEPEADSTPSKLPQRNNTWCAGLNEVCEDDDDESPVNAAEKSDESGLKAPFQQVGLPLTQIPNRQACGSLGLHCVPENRRLTGMGRQVSECSEASVTSTEAPHTEKRHQDTPLERHPRRSSSPLSSGSNLSTLDEAPEMEDSVAHEERSSTPPPRHKVEQDACTPGRRLKQDFGAVVKNTFLDIQNPEAQVPLRLVQTASGRLDC